MYYVYYVIPDVSCITLYLLTVVLKVNSQLLTQQFDSQLHDEHNFPSEWKADRFYYSDIVMRNYALVNFDLKCNLIRFPQWLNNIVYCDL